MIGRKITSMKRVGTVLATAALIAGFACSPMFATEALAWEDTYDITLKPCSEEQMAEDPEVMDAIVADYYKVADCVPDNDMYFHFEALSDFSEFQSDLDNEDIDAGIWKDLSEQAWAKIYAAQSEPTVSDVAMDVATALPMGVYLVVPHGTDKSWADFDEKTTCAETTDYEYTYEPQLIVVPTQREVIDENTGTIKTSDGDWYQATTVYIKPGCELIPPPTTETETTETETVTETTETETVTETTETEPQTTETKPPKPPKPTPKTGDDTNLTGMFIMGGVSIIVLILLGFYFVKRRKGQN